MAPTPIKGPWSVYSCGLYIPGHDVHWIQGMQAGRDAVNLSRAGKLLEVHPDGTFVIDVAHKRFRLWHHNPSKLQRLVAKNKGPVGFQLHWHLLWTRSQDGRYAFCVADADDPERRSCPAQPPTGDILDLVRDAGGVSMAAAELKAWLTRGSEYSPETEKN